MAVYKSDGVDGVSHLPKKFVRLNTQIPASTSTTFTKGEAGHNSDITADADVVVPGVLCGNAGVLVGIMVRDATTMVTTRAFAICVVAATTTPTVNFTDCEILIYDHGLYG